MRRFEQAGLFIEYRKRRAYFILRAGGKNIVRYDSPRRRRIKRDVVKTRGEQKIWHENEGVAYSIVEYDGVWAVQIKPFYMFTEKDGVTPLPSYERTARATRRMRFDRNKSVDDDLTFWACFLSQGKVVIELGGVGVPDLVVQSSYETVEVPEPGSEESGSADKSTVRG